MNMYLKELLNIPKCLATFKGDVRQLNRPINAVAIDSRKVSTGDVFVAIRGERLDGHQFLPEAIQRGALAVLVDQNWIKANKHEYLKANLFIVSDTLMALQELANNYRRKFTIPIIGLTGSVGKTTTKEMMAAILSQKYGVHKNEGNLNNHYGVPLTLFQLSEKHEIAIVEMGANHFGEIQRLAEIAEPTHAIITAVGRAHLEFFGSVEGVARAKLELFEVIKEHGVAFVNVDDPMIVQKMPDVNRKITYGFENEADIKGEILGCDSHGFVTFGLMGQQIQLKTAGLHQAKNALAAAVVGVEFGIQPSLIKEALEAYQPYSKRMEVLDIDGIRVINDCYNSNPDSAAAALQVLHDMRARGRKIAVLADMLELGQASEFEHRKIGELASQLGLDGLFGFGSMTRFTVETAKPTLKDRARHFEEKDKLISFLNDFLKKGDVVLIKGSRGMAMEEITVAIESYGSMML